MQFITPFAGRKGGRLISVVALFVTVSILVVLLSQTVFAQNTYVITDGELVTVHTSYAQDPAKVLNEAGIQLNENDFYTTRATEGGSEITLQRAQNITVDYCGEQIYVSTYGETLESLLSRTGLQYSGTYQVATPLDTLTYNGMEVVIERTVESRETYAVELPYDTEFRNDETLALGEAKVVAEGASGQKLCTADVVYKNGREISRTVLEETVIQEPQKRVILLGTGSGEKEERTTPYIGDGVIVLPSGEVLTYTRTDQFHATAYTHTDEGCDMITSTGTTVRHGTVAVDPKVIPYGTRMFIVANDGSYIYGLSTAEDCGGAIQNKRLDLYFDTTPACFQFGRRDCTVYFLGDANWNFWN